MARMWLSVVIAVQAACTVFFVSDIFVLLVFLEANGDELFTVHPAEDSATEENYGR